MFFAGRIVFNKDGVETINFGKHKGTTVQDVFAKDPGYYGWIVNSDFALDTKKTLTRLKLSTLQNKL